MLVALHNRIFGLPSGNGMAAGDEFTPAAPDFLGRTRLANRPGRCARFNHFESARAAWLHDPTAGPARAALPRASHHGGIIMFNVAACCVMLTPCALRSALPGWDEDDVLAAIRSHSLAPAFDIGLGARHLYRVLPSAVNWFTKSGGTKRRLRDDETFVELLAGLQISTVISGEQARIILNCAGGHINALVDDGELSVKAGTKRRLGPGGSDCITLASFKDFLKRRLQ